MVRSSERNPHRKPPAQQNHGAHCRLANWNDHFQRQVAVSRKAAGRSSPVRTAPAARPDAHTRARSGRSGRVSALSSRRSLHRHRKRIKPFFGCCLTLIFARGLLSDFRFRRFCTHLSRVPSIITKLCSQLSRYLGTVRVMFRVR